MRGDSAGEKSLEEQQLEPQRTQRTPGAETRFFSSALRGAEAPLFHGCADFTDVALTLRHNHEH